MGTIKLIVGFVVIAAVVAGGHKPVLSSVGITLTVNARSKHPDLAFEMIKAITGAWGKIEYTRNLGLSPNGPISADAIAYQMQSLKDPLYPEFLKLQPNGTTRVIFTPTVEEGRRMATMSGAGGRRGLVRAADELFQARPRHLVGPLLGRGLHEVGRGGQQRAADAAVERNLAAADRVDGYPG